MKIAELTGTLTRWTTFKSDVYGEIGMKVSPKTAKLEKEIFRRTIKTNMGRKNKMTVETDHKLALKLLVDGCLHDMSGLENADGTKWEFSKDGALSLLWCGPSELTQFFEDSVEAASEQAEVGNGDPSDG